MILIADPIILMAPVMSPESSKDDWSRFYDYLVDCHELIDADIHLIVISSICRDALYRSPRFPDHMQQLQEWLNQSGADRSIDAHSLFYLLTTLMKKAARLVDLVHFDFDYDSELVLIYGEPDVLLEPDDVTIDPPVITKRLEPDGDLVDAFHLTGGVLTYAFHDTGSENDLLVHDVAFLSTSMGDDGDDDLLTTTQEAFTLSVSLKSVENNPDAESVLTIRAVFNPATTVTVLEQQKIFLSKWPDMKAMMDYICHLDHTADLLPHHFAATFQESLEEMHLINQPAELMSIFKGIKKLLMRVPPDDPYNHSSPPGETQYNHHIMIGAEQIHDAGWGAWRYHVRGHVYRLHYWWRNDDNQFLLSKLMRYHTNITSIPNNRDEKLKIKLDS